MDFTAWVDVALGLAVIYLGASLFVTTINEFAAQIRNWRGKDLQKNLGLLFGAGVFDGDDKSLESGLKGLKQVFSTFWKGKPFPSYLDSALVSQLLLGTLTAGSPANDFREQALQSIGKLPEGNLKSQLQAAVVSAGAKVEDVTKSVEQWLEKSLTTLGEAYKRKIRWWSLFFGFLVAATLNIDTIELTTHLYKDKESRSAVASLALDFVEKTDEETLNRCLKRLGRVGGDTTVDDAQCESIKGLMTAVQWKNTHTARLPIGWGKGRSPVALFSHPKGLLALLGWILTAGALSLGAPFWFDALNRVANIRAGMKKPGGGRT